MTFLLLVLAQTIGHVHSGSTPVAHATVRVLNTDIVTTTDSAGVFHLPGDGYRLYISATGYASVVTNSSDVDLKPSVIQLGDVVVTADKREQDVRDLPSSVSVL